MKKYIITHDTALFEQSTIPSQNGMVASFKGIGKGEYVYGNLVSKYRVGAGSQNFVAITTPPYLNGLYVPVNAVKQVLTGISSSASQSQKSSAEGDKVGGELSEGKRQRINNIRAIQVSVGLMGNIGGLIYAKNTGGGFWRYVGYFILGGLITGVPASLIATPFVNDIIKE